MRPRKSLFQERLAIVSYSRNDGAAGEQSGWKNETLSSHLASVQLPLDVLGNRMERWGQSDTPRANHGITEFTVTGTVSLASWEH